MLLHINNRNVLITESLTYGCFFIGSVVGHGNNIEISGEILRYDVAWKSWLCKDEKGLIWIFKESGASFSIALPLYLYNYSRQQGKRLQIATALYVGLGLPNITTFATITALSSSPPLCCTKHHIMNNSRLYVETLMILRSNIHTITIETQKSNVSFKQFSIDFWWNQHSHFLCHVMSYHMHIYNIQEFF